jgi:CBS domain containing-hemolysin-like protein
LDLTANIVIIFILFLFSGFFSSSETSLFSLTDLHLHKMKSDRYPFWDMVSKLLENPQRLLITIVASNEMVNITLSVLAASLFIGLLGARGEWVSIIFTSVVLLIAGEAIPKTFGITYPMQISAMVSPVLTFISRVEYPFVAGLEKISGLILKRHGRHEPPDADALMEDEFKTLVDTGSREGVVDESQRDLIRRIFEWGDKPVTDIMIPRVDMFCISVTLPMEEIMASVVKAQHERIPVYSGDRDDIIGILFAKELLNSTWLKGKPEGLEKLLKKAYFVPEEKTINGLLHDFQENRTQIAIVVDEYGGVSGMVTLRDILGHLFENPYDESGLTDEEYEKIDENVIIVSGKMEMEKLNDLLQTQFPLDEFDTVGGFVLHLFGKLPAKDEETNFEGFRFKVENVDRARILKVKVTKETII